MSLISEPDFTANAAVTFINEPNPVSARPLIFGSQDRKPILLRQRRPRARSRAQPSQPTILRYDGSADVLLGGYAVSRKRFCSLTNIFSLAKTLLGRSWIFCLVM